jgi:hypothetical protein
MDNREGLPYEEMGLAEQKEADTLKKLGMALEREQVNDQKSQREGTVFSRVYGPAIEALRSTCKDEGVLARRLNS